jgi:general nucleoside transport system ATP-binding protein
MLPIPDPQISPKEVLVSLRGVTKRFRTVLANDQIDLDIYQGEIHALLGENGAGKSTLMKILYGFYRSDAGEVLFRGKSVQIRSPQDARRLQIGMVFQSLNLIPAMTVAENIALFWQDLPAVYQPQKINERIEDFSRQFGLEIQPDDLVSQLSIGEQQKVEILKLLLSNARLLILDEPTRVLAPHEIEALFGVLDRLRNSGYTFILITHKLRDVLRCADRITVLRGGRVVGSLVGSQATEERLVSLMFEKEVSTQFAPPASPSNLEMSTLLELRSVCTQAEGAATSLQDINLNICTGEIVGIAGVSGNGQKELGDMVLGMERIIKGQKILFGKDYTQRSIGDIRKGGVSFIPENPLSMATVPFMSVLENMALTNIWRYARSGGFRFDWDAVHNDMQAAFSRFGFTFSPYSMVRSLSGGNLQRLIVAREMAHQPKLIIASYLTSGLDVQSAMVVRQALLQARMEDAGVLLISEDLDELFSLSDRLIVLFDGKVVGEFKPAETDPYSVGRLMTGSKE